MLEELNEVTLSRAVAQTLLYLSPHSLSWESLPFHVFRSGQSLRQMVRNPED